MKPARHSTKVVPIKKPNSTTIGALADVVGLLHRNKLDVAEARVIAETMSGEPKTLAAVVKALKMPFSTASRVCWELSERGLLTYASHPTDRRKKLLRSHPERLA